MIRKYNIAQVPISWTGSDVGQQLTPGRDGPALSGDAEGRRRKVLIADDLIVERLAASQAGIAN